MEVKEIVESLNDDQKVNKDLRTDIIEKIDKINRAKEVLGGMEQSLMNNAAYLKDNQIEYIKNKCVSYRKIFRVFERGGVVDYEDISKIADKILSLEDAIRNNDFSRWTDAMFAYAGTKEDEEEDEIDSMMIPSSEDNSFVENLNKVWDSILYNVKTLRTSLGDKLEKFKEEQRAKKKERENNRIERIKEESREEDAKLEDIEQEHETRRRRRRNIDLSTKEITENEELKKAVENAVSESSEENKRKNEELLSQMLGNNVDKEHQENAENENNIQEQIGINEGINENNQVRRRRNTNND